MNKEKIVIIALLENGKGLGHYFRSVTVAKRLEEYDVHIIQYKSNKMIDFLDFDNKKQYQCLLGTELFEILNNIKPNLIINDLLNTSTEYMKSLMSLGCKIINFDDVGEGSKLADLVINGTIEGDDTEQYKFGHRYVDIRQEFKTYGQKLKSVKNDVKKVLLTFGGEDPSDITRRVLNIITKNAKLSKITYEIALGPRYKWIEEVRDIVEQNNLSANIHINKDIAKIINDVDLAVIANCRTVFEIAYLNIPAVVISANKNECTHNFYKTVGYKYCGEITTASDYIIQSNIEHLVDSYSERQDIFHKLSNSDLSKGLDRIIKVIKSSLNKEKVLCSV